MNTNEKIKLASAIREQITARAPNIWPGFTPVPFILYDGESQAAVGPKWPERYTRVRDDIWLAEGFDSTLMGNTSMMYHGEVAAVWDTRTWPDHVDIAAASSGIAHEMFHAFQQTNMSLSFANELLLPQYPHNERSIALVIGENQWLTSILADSNPDSVRNCIGQIAALRVRREAEIGPEYMEYDKNCETGEGTAAYAEIRMKALIEDITPFEAAASYLPVLHNNERLLPRYRNRCYSAGLIFCLAADILFGDWQAEWMESGQPIFDWIRDQLPVAAPEAEPPWDPSVLTMAGTMLAEYNQERERKINDFLLSEPLTAVEGNIQLTGFDPMNLVCFDGRCLHLHGKVKFGERDRMITTPFLAEYGKNILDVKRFLIPAKTYASWGDPFL
jgi:hypothetical protein